LGADFADPQTLAPLAGRSFDLVYYIATPDSYDDDGYRRAYVDGLRNVLDVVVPDGVGEDDGRRAAVPRVIFVSSTAVYGQSEGEWVDETSPTEPQRFSGRRTREAERLLAACAGVEPIAVRFAGIYGPGRTRLVRSVGEGKPCHDDPPRWTNRIHEDDVVGVLLHVGRLAEPASLYVGVDHEPATDCRVADFIAGELGVPRPPRRKSGDAAGVGVRGANKRCRNDRLVQSGYRFRWPTYREGYGAMLRGAED
jgi:nucleoside-diphosphate-sugar epimerase